jgi:hypothetical protein
MHSSAENLINLMFLHTFVNFFEHHNLYKNANLKSYLSFLILIFIEKIHISFY